MDQTPSVGRVVHYVDSARFSQHCAAVITEVETANQRVGLAVMTPGETIYIHAIDLDPAAATNNTWHWPEPVAPSAPTPDGQASPETTSGADGVSAPPKG